MTEETIFAEALERRTPADRSAYLDEACAGDPALRARVGALLGSHEGGTAFLDVPAVEQAARCIPAGSLDETQAETAGDIASFEPLEFLEPATAPGALGRLGHYEVMEVVGRGGMGVVLRAFDAKLHRVVAIKVMAAELAASATARRRFSREAQAAAAVVNEHVVTIHAVEEDHRPPYLVMQFVEGVSLQEKLDRVGALELKEILRIGMQAAEGLAAAHRQGLVHRDIKPANILLENGVERVKITDFGLARAADDASLTQSGVIAGTPPYMSPEQAEGDPVDHRSDLFSLGSVLYAACTGRAPFRAGSAVAVLRRVCGEAPRPIREVNPEVPEWLGAIVARLHAKVPADRYQSAAEVAALLGRRLAGLQRPEHLPDEPTGESRAPAAPRRGRRRLVAAAALLVVLIGAGLTEATGVTHVAGTVIRLLSPEGTLVVEVDDPGVSVAVDGSDVVITGAGAREIRLKAGQYTVMASKGGKVIKQELVRVTRDGRQVVRVSHEGADAAAVAGRPADGRPERFPPGSPADLLTSDEWEWTEPANLGPVVNGPGDDRGPSLTADGLLMTFFSNRHGGRGDFDLWECRRPSADAPFGPPAHLEGPINGPGFDADPCLGPDGLTILFGSTRPGGSGSADLWEARRASRDEAWGEPVNLGSPVNGPDWETGPTLSRDGLTLAFHSNRGGGLGGDDLWMSRRASRDAPFGAPTNLGPGINHAVGDGAPRLSGDGLALFYSSVNDLLLATRPSPDGDFGAARLLDPPFNTGHYDSSPWPSPDARTLFFDSHRPGGQGGLDLWMARRVRKPRLPDPTTADAEAWKRSVAELPAESQVAAVAARLKVRNPGFDGAVTPTIEGGVVTGLKFSGEEVVDLTPVRALRRLRQLVCHGIEVVGRRGKLRDLGPLRGLPLTDLDCHYTSVSDLEPLRGMRLGFLNAGGTLIEDLAPLRGMPLRWLYLGYTPVRDFSLLKGMPLGSLNLQHTAVTDLGFLAGKPIHYLRIEGTAIDDLSVVRGMPLEHIGCDFQPDRDAEVLRSNPTLKTINGKPPADFWKEVDAPPGPTPAAR